MGHRSRRPDAAAIQALVIDAVAMAARVEPEALDPCTSLLAAGLDSLTLLAALTRIELALRVAFETHELLDLLRATDFAELCALIARKVEAQRERKSR